MARGKLVTKTGGGKAMTWSRVVGLVVAGMVGAVTPAAAWDNNDIFPEWWGTWTQAGKPCNSEPRFILSKKMMILYYKGSKIKFHIEEIWPNCGGDDGYACAYLCDPNPYTCGFNAE